MDNHNRTRRLFLRNVLISSCAVGATGLLAACGRNESDTAARSQTMANDQMNPDSASEEKNTGNRNADAPESSSAGYAPASDSSVKVSKETANYQDQPKGNDSCANCLHFMADSRSCALVEGDISPDGWCTFWVSNA